MLSENQIPTETVVHDGERAMMMEGEWPPL